MARYVLVFTSLCLLTLTLAREKHGHYRQLKLEKDSNIRCPPGQPHVDCVISPCKAERLLGRRCTAHPEAACANTLCGGCVARHYVDGEEVYCGKEENVICELQNSSLSCPVNHVMRVKHANYGRTDTSTCRHSYNLDSMHNNTDCHSTNATGIVQKLCDGLTRCWLDVSSRTFGDPCYAIYKYLQVDYECVPIHKYLRVYVKQMLLAPDTQKSQKTETIGKVSQCDVVRERTSHSSSSSTISLSAAISIHVFPLFLLVIF